MTTQPSQRMAAFFGCAGPTLGAEEAAFFRETRPLGFILFARNIQTPLQTRALTDALRACVDNEPVPILVDQEGGRVARVRPPHGHLVPSARRIGALGSARAARLAGRLCAHAVISHGMDATCAPCLDVSHPGGHGLIGDRAHGDDPALVATLGAAHGVIGDRAYSDDPALVATLGAAFVAGVARDGFAACVVKHAPGLGATEQDPHDAMPTIPLDADRLRTEGAAFAQTALLAGGVMTAHARYPGLDAAAPSPYSAKVVDFVRDDLGGAAALLITDALEMNALEGEPLATRAARALAAGHDAVLHCSGELAAMARLARGAGAASASARAKAARLVASHPRADAASARADAAELARLLGGSSATSGSATSGSATRGADPTRDAAP